MASTRWGGGVTGQVQERTSGQKKERKRYSQGGEDGRDGGWKGE